MSAYTFPTLPGLDPSVDRTVEYDTTIHKTVSGKEQRTSWQSTPRYRYRLTFNVLREAVTVSAVGTPWNGLSEVAALVSVFNTHLGNWDSFSYTDPLTSSTVTVRFDPASVVWKRIVPGVWSCEFTLYSVK